MMLDFVATRYHVLPSKLLNEGSSIDYLVAQYATDYQRHLQEQEEMKREGGVDKNVKVPPKLSQEKMKAMMERARNGR